MGVKGLRRHTAEEDGTLIRLVNMGKSTDEIGRILGRTKDSISSRIHWLHKHGVDIILPSERLGRLGQMKLAACAATTAERTVAADPVSEIRSRIAELKKREEDLTGQLDDVRDEMAGIFAQLTELIGAVK